MPILGRIVYSLEISASCNLTPKEVAAKHNILVMTYAMITEPPQFNHHTKHF